MQIQYGPFFILIHFHYILRHYALCSELNFIFPVRMNLDGLKQGLRVNLTQSDCLFRGGLIYLPSFLYSLLERGQAKHTMLLSNISHMDHHASNTSDAFQCSQSRGYSHY